MNFGKIISCTDCAYAVPVKLQSGANQCRKNPPIAVPVQGHGGLGSVSMYPIVGKGDGCGEGWSIPDVGGLGK